jgi:hypothetical protein
MAGCENVLVVDEGRCGRRWMVEGKGGERRTLCPKRASCSSDGVGSSPSVPLPKHSLQAVDSDFCQRDVEDDGRGWREAEEAGEGRREGMPDRRGTSRGSSGLDCPWSDRRFPRQALPCGGRRVSRVGGGGDEQFSPCVENTRCDGLRTPAGCPATQNNIRCR